MSVLVTGEGTDKGNRDGTGKGDGGGNGKRLLILGDLLHTRAQYDNSDWAFRSDVDPERARASRRDVLARFRDGRTVLAGGDFHGVAFG
ncbi:hypothetical protein [Dactylosporangium matsuzakiense]|nr:hypothetical protein [Dactylosporangium matsuzakiense]UWZ47735.1 hypothetical protein Dmats_15825 [Dactylosporangium matsuzakiense]